MRKKRLILGDIYQIPLPNGKYAYARLFKEFTLAIYEGQYNRYSDLSAVENYVFFVGVFKDLLEDGEWEIVGNRPFENEIDAWPPPMCVKDALRGKFSLYVRGELIQSTEEECKELERVAAWDRNHVVDRIMGDDKWNPK